MSLLRTAASAVIVLILSVPQFVLAAETGPAAGKLAPPVELADLSGKTVKLSDFAGKIVVLNFWSTLCGPCTAEMPSLNSLAAAFKAEGLVVLGVAIDKSDKPVRAFVAEKKIAYPILLDFEKEVFFDNYAGPSLPATYLIGRDGIIIEAFTGARDWASQEIKSRIAALLKPAAEGRSK